MPRQKKKLVRRALRIEQNNQHPLYLLSMSSKDILDLADISRISRDSAGKLIGYQRPEVKQHIKEIVTYLNADEILFPNSIIISLSSRVIFKRSRGPSTTDGLASSGTLEIPLPGPRGKKPGWIVDGQQRVLALSKSKRRDFPVPVNAFIADEVDLQRDQFIRVNNTKPLPRGLVTELLPEVAAPLPQKMTVRKIPSALCNLLNTNPDSPFYGLIKRASSTPDERKKAVITDTSIVNMLLDSLKNPSGCLFPYRNISTGESDYEGMWALLITYWSAVAKTFPDAWGKKPSKSRLMHGVGIRSMGRLMDKVMSTVNPHKKNALRQVQKDVALVKQHCHWTKGVWTELGGLRWNELQNVPRHIRVLSNHLVRTYVQAKRSVR